MPEIILRRQSWHEDRYSLHFGQRVAIYDITRSEADGICSTYKRMFVSEPMGDAVRRRRDDEKPRLITERRAA